MNDGLELSVRDIVIRSFLVSLPVAVVRSVGQVAIHARGRQRGRSKYNFCHLSVLHR